MKLYLDDSEVPEKDVTGLKDLTITHQDVDDTGATSRSFTTSLTFTGATYQSLRTSIILDPNGELFVQNVKITDEDCCDGYMIFEGEIRGSSAKWCEGSCEIAVTVYEKKEASDCIHSTLIYESKKKVKNATETNFIDKHHPRFQWCDDPGNNTLGMRFALAFGFTEFLIINIPTVYSIQFLINATCYMIQFFSFGQFTCPDNIVGDSIVQAYRNFIRQVERYVTGCGNYHPAPTMLDYINNVCEICGVQFQSSILNDPDSPYYNSAYLDAPASIGTNEGDGIEFGLGDSSGTKKYWVPDNAPILTLDVFLNKIKGLHNAKWVVKDIADPISGNKVPTLIYEREDFFDNQEIWIDFSQIPPEDIISQCYDFSDEKVPALGIFTYQKDGVDDAGDKRIGALYSDTVEWNPFPLNRIQVGSLDVTPQFGGVAVRGDNVIRDPRSDAIAKIGDTGTIFKRAEKCLLIASGLTGASKAIIWDGKSREDARVKEYFGGALADQTNHSYNAPYYFREIGIDPAQYVNDKLQMTIHGNLYHNFWQIRNPRLKALKRRKYEIVFNFHCNHLQTLDVSKNVLLVYEGTPKVGNISTVSVQFGEKRQMTIQGYI